MKLQLTLLTTTLFCGFQSTLAQAVNSQPSGAKGHRTGTRCITRADLAIGQEPEKRGQRDPGPGKG